MMGRFKEILGIGKIIVGGHEFEVSPTMNDCEAFSHIRKLVEQKKDVEGLKKNADLLYLMICAQDKDLDDEDKDELKRFLYLHQKEALEEAQILFKWTTREEREQQKELINKALMDGDLLKKLMAD